MIEILSLILSSYYLAYNLMNSPLFIFKWIREFLVKKLKVNPYLFSCYYCTGFWSSLIMYIVHLYFPIINHIFSIAVLVVIVNYLITKLHNYASN
ncbi:MAG: DUF1360 domain-containing protein [Candidatus Nanopusillus sp.]